MTNNLKTLMDILFPLEQARRAKGGCPICGDHVDPDEFRDDLSRKEFEISGLCQECQDEVFQV